MRYRPARGLGHRCPRPRAVKTRGNPAVGPWAGSLRPGPRVGDACRRRYPASWSQLGTMEWSRFRRGPRPGTPGCCRTGCPLRPGLGQPGDPACAGSPAPSAVATLQAGEMPYGHPESREAQRADHSGDAGSARGSERGAVPELRPWPLPPFRSPPLPPLLTPPLPVPLPRLR